MSIKYVHTNIIAEDWRKLADFYIKVFQCKAMLPERDLSGEWIEKVTAISDVHIQGVHLELPGYVDGPTLEIFSYDQEDLREEKSRVNTQGYGHLAFHVDDVEEVLEKLMEMGGSKLGDVIKKEYDEIGTLTIVYARDPEGNIVEIQNWS